MKSATYVYLFRLPQLSLLLLLSAAGLGAAQAQAPTSVTGAVRTAAGAPIEYATVTLHRAADSTVVKTEFSDDKGAFRLDQPAGGRYLISASQVGFVRRWSAPFELAPGGITLEALTLTASGATQLKEVTVVGQKPLFEHQADRTVVNVAGSPLAAGNTTLDVLARAPGVTVDGNDNLALRGKQGLLVLIDGKRQPMSGSELAEYLRALPAEQLQSIELITNPPAKYDAQGGAGIIAINLKKDQRQGTNGSANAAYGRGQYGKFTGGLSLNHRHQKLNLFASYNYTNRNGYGKLNIHRDFYENTDSRRTLVGSSDQANKMLSGNRSHSWKVGADYSLSKNTDLGVVVNGLENRGPRMPTTNATSLFDQNGQLIDTYVALGNRSFHAPSLAGNVNFKHTFPADSSGARELTADADYAHYNTDRLQDLTTSFGLSGRSQVRNDGDQSGQLTIQSAKADYVHPLSKDARFEAGLKASRVHSDNDVLFEITENGVRSVDANRTNRFKYNEDIRAAYVNFNQTISKLNVQLGLRGEQTKATGQQVVGNQSFNRNYFQLFPSAALKQTLSDKHEVSLSLSRRIDRPSYGQLNPFRIIIDPTTSGAGNPYLRPQTSYNFELTHTYKQKFSTGLSYSITSNPIIQVVQPESGRNVVSTSVNLGKQYYYALTLTAPVELAKWWSVYNNGVFYYSRFVGHLAGTALDKGRPAFNLSSTSTLTFGQGWSAELNGRYQSREQYGFLDVRPNGQVGLGLQKSVLERKGTLKLNATDIFFTGKVRATSAYDNYVEHFYQRGDFRVVTLSFSYRFGNDKVAPTRKRTGGAEDEKRRASGS
ncbi:outer membrane beta-barrel protein [Hymenobacter jejuensis]|uniref:TonB-dependent receptor n=1 Tax=Hymenobacter jejuensis TaxID=2502781 RepID=A0A5B8A4I0_9BACT|nr:outer membrane beta-barrel protein [Hymenobacter jejuensis]QDA62200.1 TonB-dependent receptor [Hymenobacter jejuensis]